jgi:ribonuclease III
MSLKEFQKHNGIRFKNEELLQQAFIHRSYVSETGDARPHNERLEFLGDAILAFIAGEMLYDDESLMSEGDMTRLRAALVRGETLAIFGRECRIGEMLLMARGEEIHGGRDSVNFLSDGFEAFLGALYVDQGMKAARKFLLPRLKRRLSEVVLQKLDKDARSLFQEHIQHLYGIVPDYETVDVTGPGHERLYTQRVSVAGKTITEGSGRSKQLAAQAAALNALAIVEKGELVIDAPLRERHSDAES